MALDVGWRIGETRDSYWYEDPAFFDPPEPEALAAAEKALTAAREAHAAGNGTEDDVDDAARNLKLVKRGTRRIPAGALEEYIKTGDGAHIITYARPGLPPEKQATKIVVRPMTADEVNIAQGLYGRARDGGDASARLATLCFRIAVDLPLIPSEIADSRGVKHSRYVDHDGIKMLANEFVIWLEAKHPGITAFYGNLAIAASFPTEAEKKA